MLRKVINSAVFLALACPALPAHAQDMGTNCTVFGKLRVLVFYLKDADTDYQVGNALPAGTLGAFKARGGAVEIKSAGSTIALKAGDCVLTSLDGDLHLVAKASGTQVKVLLMH
jgi:hypothetical protein